MTKKIAENALDYEIEEKRRADEVVAWTLNFIYQDLSTINGAERMILTIDAHQHLIKRFDQVGIMNEETKKFIIETMLLEKIQNALHDTFETYLLPLIKGESARTPGVQRPKKIEIEWYEVDQGELNSPVIFEEQYDWEIKAVFNFRYALYSLLPLPINTFQKCEGCGRYFFPGKGARQTRRFCTRACNLRTSAKNRRKAQKKQKADLSSQEI